MSNIENKIFIIMKDGKPIMLGSASSKPREDLHSKIWNKAHKKVDRGNIDMLKSLKIYIKRFGYEPKIIKQ